MNVGFIGLGRMGNHMARHLAEAGHALRVYDLRPEAVTAQAAQSGVRAGSGYADIARSSEIVFTSLPGPKEVEEVVQMEGGLLDAMRPGTVYVDLSTNAPRVVRGLEPLLKERGISMLDAPVSGGVEGAEAGTLSIMVGGDEETFERLRPVLSSIGDKLFYCGAIGAGSVVKLCNNICGASYGLILGEALTLGVKAGVDLATLTSVIGASTGTSNRLTRRFPRFLFKRNFEPGFSAALSAKDTRLALDLAGEVGVPMALGSVIGREMEEVLARGWGDLDFDASVRLQEERTGIVLELPEKKPSA
jgi:3-hydroxyisobutyrate dehydrogenase